MNVVCAVPRVRAWRHAHTTTVYAKQFTGAHAVLRFRANSIVCRTANFARLDSLFARNCRVRCSKKKSMKMMQTLALLFVVCTASVFGRWFYLAFRSCGMCVQAVRANRRRSRRLRSLHATRSSTRLLLSLLNFRWCAPMRTRFVFAWTCM